MIPDSISGYNVNELELSPNYAGTLKGATGTIANICGFLTPALAGYLTDGQQFSNHAEEIKMIF